MRNAFTLAELLIALAILGVIATFTIPKILDSGNSSKHNAIAKETLAMVSGAWQTYKLENGASASTSIDALTPYMNYVKDVTNQLVDNVPGFTTDSCVPNARWCLLLHNGALLQYYRGTSFNDTASTNVITFLIDPDGVYGGSTTGPSKSVQAFLYYNGRLRTWGTLEPATYWSGGGPVGPVAGREPEYFSWGS